MGGDADSFGRARLGVVAVLTLFALGAAALAVFAGPWWWLLAGPLLVLAVLARTKGAALGGFAHCSAIS